MQHVYMWYVTYDFCNGLILDSNSNICMHFKAFLNVKPGLVCIKYINQGR